MTRFSIRTAIGEAFGLIRRRPLSVWVWGLLLMTPGAAALALVFPAMADVFADMPPPGDFEWAPPPRGANPLGLMTDWVSANWYWAVLGGVVASFVYGVLITMSVAPHASACRQLAEGRTPSPVDERAPVA